MDGSERNGKIWYYEEEDENSKYYLYKDFTSSFGRQRKSFTSKQRV